MPADRRITVNVSTEGSRNEHGEFVPGTVTAIAAWALRRDVSQERKIERQGTRTETLRDWRVRWDSRIASTPVARLKVIDGAETFQVVNMIEVTAQRGGAPDLRRRFIDLQGIRS